MNFMFLNKKRVRFCKLFYLWFVCVFLKFFVKGGSNNLKLYDIVVVMVIDIVDVVYII